MEELELQLDVFSGPLDLLLHLIKQLEIDIYDIPITTITTQYMHYIHQMKEHQLDIAGEYIVMASTLMSIKSKMLIPKQDVDLSAEEDDYEDPRQDLVQQLLVYQAIQSAADWFDQKQEERLDYYVKPPMNLDAFKEKVKPLEKGDIQAIELKQILETVLIGNVKPPETIIKSDSETIQKKMTQLRQIIQERKEITFTQLFNHYERSEIVTTFLAMLELMKEKTVVVMQDARYAPIVLSYKE